MPGFESQADGEDRIEGLLIIISVHMSIFRKLILKWGIRETEDNL